MQIRYKLGLMVAGLSFIILSMFLVTWYTTSAQKTDGLVINLAGRQRMLSQKMSKDLLQFTGTEDEKERTTLASITRNTIHVFDMTLTALSGSGKAPLSLDMKGEMAQCPKAVEPAFSQLVKVSGLWQTFSDHMEKVLATGSVQSLAYIKAQNLILLKEMNTVVVMLQKISEEKIKRLIFLQTIGLFVGVILLGISLFQIHGIVKNLNQSADTANELRKGDLRKRFETVDRPVNKLDELDFLGHNLNTFADSLQNSIWEINTEAGNLKGASNDMAGVAVGLSKETGNAADKTSNVARHAETMSEDMNAVAAAMEELTANTNDIAQSTSRIADTSKNIAGDAEKAREISTRAVENVESASSRVEDLGNAALKVGQVSQAITDISEQINLLALNATIEAARAGEAGKGFAVVADEIKSLAHQTADATEQIKENITWIQGATASTTVDIKEIAQVINEVDDIVKNITSEVEDQTDTIDKININVSQGAEAVQEVSTNVVNTSDASTQIVSDINEVNQSISQVSANTDGIAGNADKLSQLAGKLHKMVSHFTVE